MVALALALNETYEYPSLNLSLNAALENVMFNGVSVSLLVVYQLKTAALMDVLHNRVL